MKLLPIFLLLTLLINVGTHQSAFSASSKYQIREHDQFQFQYIRGRKHNIVYLHSDRYQFPRVIFSYPHGLMSGAEHSYSKTFTLEEMNKVIAQGLVWANQDYIDSLKDFFSTQTDYDKRLSIFKESLEELTGIISLPPNQRDSAIGDFMAKIDLKYPPKLKKTIWEKLSIFVDNVKEKTTNSHVYSNERDFLLSVSQKIKDHADDMNFAGKLSGIEQNLKEGLKGVIAEKARLNNKSSLSHSGQSACINTSWQILVDIFNNVLFGNDSSPWKVYAGRASTSSKKEVFDRLYLKLLTRIKDKKCRQSLATAFGIDSFTTSSPAAPNNHLINELRPSSTDISGNRKGFEGLYDLLFYVLFDDSEHKPTRITKNKLNKLGGHGGGLFQVEAAIQLSNICKKKNDYLYEVWKDQEGNYTDRDQYLELHRQNLRNKVRREILLSSLELEKEMLPLLPNKFDLPHYPAKCPMLDNSMGDLDLLNNRLREQVIWNDNYSNIYNDVKHGRENREKVRKRYLSMIIEATLIKTLMESYAWKELLWPFASVAVPKGNFTPWYPVDTFPPQPGHMQHRLNRINQDIPLLKWRKRYDLTKPLTWSGFTSATLGDTLDKVTSKAVDTILAKAPKMIQKNYIDLVAKIRENSGQEEDDSISNWFQSTPKQKVLVNREQQRILRSIFYFFSFQLPLMINDVVSEGELVSWEKLEPSITDYYQNWKKHIENMRLKACTTDNKSLYESLPSMVLAHLSRENDQGKGKLEKAGQLDAYCNGPFGKTWRNVFEQYGPSLGAGLFIAGTSIPVIDGVYTPSAKAATYTTGLAIASISSAMNTLKGVDRITTETALFKLSKKTEHEKDYGILTDAAKAALASIFGRTLGNWIATTKGWRFFVPYKINWSSGQYMILLSNFGISTAFDILAHIDKNINPLTSKWFWMSRTGSFLSALLFAHAGDPGTFLQIPMAAVYNAMGQFYLYSEIELTFRNLQLIEHQSLGFVEFETLWQLAPNYVTTSAVYSSNMILERIVPPKFVALAQFAVSELEAFLSMGYYGKGKINYLEDGLGFFESLIQVDFKQDLLRIRKEAPRFKTNLSKKRIQASKELFDSLPEENRKLLKEIFCLNYGFLKLKQKMNPAERSPDSGDSYVESLAFMSPEQDPIVKACGLNDFDRYK